LKKGVRAPLTLKGLTALQQLDLSNTQVANLEPLKGLTALQLLDLPNTRVPASEIDRIQQYRKQNGLSAMNVQKS
jgi:Leucine-rich repeat (LRR) protein